MNQRGSALLTTVISVTILLFISGVLFSNVMYQYKTEASEEKALKAYYLAEAGINYGIATILVAKANGLSQPSLADPPLDHYGSNGSILVNCTDYSNEAFLTVTSKGTYLGVTRTLVEQYNYLE